MANLTRGDLYLAAVVGNQQDPQGGGVGARDSLGRWVTQRESALGCKQFCFPVTVAVLCKLT